MLKSLSIRDIVLIESLTIEFGSGLGVLTGETGAGKSILLDSLGLALGARADSGLVRGGAERGIVTAAFDPPTGAVAALLDENGIDVEPGEPLLLKRQLRADGGSRATINDQAASAGLMREIGGRLVEIHGQHDDRGLLNPTGHRALLDSFAGTDTRALAAAHRAWRAAAERLGVERAQADEAERDREFVAHAMAELDALAPEPGEEATLAAQRTDMQKGERIAGDLTEVVDVFAGSDGALASLRGAARRLDRLAPEHPLLADALASLDRAVIEATEAEDKLAEVGRALPLDPARLDAVETRLFDLRGLARKHRVEPDELAELRARMRERLDRIEAGGEGLAALEAEVAAARIAYRAAADEVTAVRTAAAERLDRAVEGELKPLKLDAARFRTQVEPLEEGQWGPRGADRVAFTVSTNPGAPFGGLTKIASGGELSRFILALKVALAEEGGAPTMIFDEIDRGVGGAVASAIGDRLARLAGAGGGRQLLVVTHSPQVAARGAHHLLIAKASDGTVARTGVAELDEARRREEIARMLSGAEITDEARAQAERLLEVVG